MDLIVDGHNLIAQTPGMSLAMLDDEQRLVELLVAYCRGGGHRAEVFFDGAPPGQARVQNFGRVRAHFVAERSTADEAIRRRLKKLGRAAKNWLVVSSDRAVQAAAREAGARIMAAEEFAGQMQAPQPASGESSKPGMDEPLSEAELREWEALFKRKSGSKGP